MTVIVPFEAADLDTIEVQPSQRGRTMTGDFYAAAGPAWTARGADGRVLACAGLIALGPSYRLAWAVLAEGKRGAMVAITRAARRLMVEGGWRRVEMLTDARCPEAGDWAALLGFEREGVRRCALPDGGDLVAWAIVRGDW